MKFLNKISVSDRINANPFAGDISSPVNGDIWYNSSLNKFRKYEAGSISDLISGGGGGANALGTYLVQTATNAPSNAQVMASLGSGLVKNTTATGVQSIAVAGTDYVLPNGTNTNYANDYRAANFVAGTNYLAPNGSAAALTSFPTFNQNTTGSAATLTTARTISGTGEATFTTNAFDGSAVATGVVTLTNSAVIAKVLTGYTKGSGTVAATDSILQAFQKLDGNADLKAPLASPTFTGTVTLPAGQVVNGVTLSTAQGTTNFLRGDGTYATPAGGGGGGLTWTEITTTTQTTVGDNGYIANNASLVTFTLPATAVIGKVIKVVGKGAGGWRVSQQAGQSIRFGNVVTTSGTGGYIASTIQYDSIELVCITANTGWTVVSSQGNITYI